MGSLFDYIKFGIGLYIGMTIAEIVDDKLGEVIKNLK